VVTIWSAVKKYLAFLPETLAFGLHLGKFKYLTRVSRPVEPARVWELLAEPPRAIRLIEESYPTRLQMRAMIGFLSLTMLFQNHESGISDHYDLSNEFFGLFLDSRFRFYSAGDFASPSDTLEDAQERKAQRFLEMIDPKPGQRIFDAGAGWGGMLNRVHQAVGRDAELIGYTLSREQQRYVDETYGLKVEFKDFVTADYEDASFDTIYSIETFEHVRMLELPRFAAKLRRALKPKGKLLCQLTCLAHELPPPYALYSGLDTFPGSEATPLPRYIKEFERASFRIQHLQLLDYRPTFRAWFNRLGERQEEAVAMVGVRHYMRFLCFLASTWRLFDSQEIYSARMILHPV
jgi:cyclopropane-fatty-acyl-phospholipid synthase